ncbi:hypothetical protein NDU88_004668 [Pleurodeles waltl]|uniref:Uncharacterized protein n=1 Tax=Pleurodeles waltl TaxID=8319 RepID=A0AAV7RGD1_PLEWA|nr:hypothetical protein NDU88_004668 [Pleurodeles waltl]
MYNDAGESSPPPKSLLTVRPPGSGGSKAQKPASENHRSSPEHRPGEICSRPKLRDAWRLSSVRREFTGSVLADRHVPPCLLSQKAFMTAAKQIEWLQHDNIDDAGMGF